MGNSRMHSIQPRGSTARPLCWFGIGVTLLISGCAPVFSFRPVTPMKGTAQVFCGYDEAYPTAIVVAVFAEDAVENARFIVKPVSNAESASGLPFSERKPSVYIPKKKATCIRVPLPPVPSDVRKYNVSVSGFSGKEPVTGGQIECEPRPVLNWDCEIQ